VDDLGVNELFVEVSAVLDDEELAVVSVLGELGHCAHPHVAELLVCADTYVVVGHCAVSFGR
jgi:hypothetical protein